MNKIYKHYRISIAIRMCQKITKTYNTYNSVRLFGWPIKGTKINSAQGTRCCPSYRMQLNLPRGLGDTACRKKGQQTGMQVTKTLRKCCRISPKDKQKPSGLNRRTNQKIKAHRNGKKRNNVELRFHRRSELNLRRRKQRRAGQV
jgi:hypothetical protein